MIKQVLAIVSAVIIVLSFLFFTATPVGRGVWNNWFYGVQ